MILNKIKRNFSRYDFREDTPTYLSISETIEARKEKQSAILKKLFKVLLLSLLITILSSMLPILSGVYKIGIIVSSALVALFIGHIGMRLLFSVYSPIWKYRFLSILELATERLDLIQLPSNKTQIKTVEWKFYKEADRIVIKLNPSGTIPSIQQVKELSRRLTEFLLQATHEEWNLLESTINKNIVVLKYGENPIRYSVSELFEITDDDYCVNHNPIKLYDNIFFDIASEASHQIIIAPSGAGKSLYLATLAGLLIKQGHSVSLIDAKQTSLGATFENLGIPVARNAEEIVLLLEQMVFEMEDTYKRYFSFSSVDFSTTYSDFSLPAHYLIFDEVLAALESGTPSQQKEMVRLLKILALKSRASGRGLLILASQKLLASDLPRAVTEQCQTRIILGSESSISEETFYSVMGKEKRDLLAEYRGGVGKGYILTPKTNGIKYFETPYFDLDSRDFKDKIKDFQTIPRKQIE
ncbi:cell division protein FtsK [Streptococcus suis]|uniref:FtsK/SpoIIIE family protein n=1 Tax=Streptococcus suis TaxID=1307 RepID=A0A116MYJ5_STRSU|nr:cell division protein FtsK [Streptococcus suis]WNF86702.1 cell division protein FtsK [Streptococcus parasuis]NQG42355.1 cell division protein FtsK [Streptococcus suis]NQG72852.1 cell division protein FtsK [Streptococcus suis]NQK66801.1 cell division protein FtsK [Streptococcus suis]NQQ49922.1 cell division protein FtsK [Streptococcus suis]